MIVHDNQPADEQDWATIQDAMRTALTIVEGEEHEWHFLQLLVLILENEAGWPPDDPNTIWAVAVHCDRFPIIHHDDGKILWGEPEDALVFSTTPVFWGERYMVDLARRRAARHDRRRALDGEPYLDHGV